MRHLQIVSSSSTTWRTGHPPRCLQRGSAGCLAAAPDRPAAAAGAVAAAEAARGVGASRWAVGVHCLGQRVGLSSYGGKCPALSKTTSLSWMSRPYKDWERSGNVIGGSSYELLLMILFVVLLQCVLPVVLDAAAVVDRRQNGRYGQRYGDTQRRG